jgi:hypothetical protein
LRAVEVLRGVDVVAAEDTRHSGLLLKHFEIKKPFVSYHEHNEAARTAEVGRPPCPRRKRCVNNRRWHCLVFPIQGCALFANALIANCRLRSSPDPQRSPRLYLVPAFRTRNSRSVDFFR